MPWSRRRLIESAVLAMAASAAPVRSVLAQALNPAARRIAFANLHTNEFLDVDYFHDGDYDAAALEQIAFNLRDFRAEQTHPIDPGLLDVLHSVAGSLGVDPVFELISGYRAPATNDMLRSHSEGVARNSWHMQGRAADIRMTSVGTVDIARHALELKLGGVGYYAGSDFVHLDTGAVRSWTG